jgi:uncharacterized protein YukE
MAAKKEETASFVMRFTQKIYNSDDGEAQVQWRGHIRHVQSDDETRFSNYDEATAFVEKKLSDMTMQAVEDKSPEEKEGILSRSLGIWKMVKENAPKMVMETIKDPKKVVQYQEQIREQIKEQIQQVGDDLNERLEKVDEWRGMSKSDYKNLMRILEKLSDDVAELKEKDNAKSKKK